MTPAQHEAMTLHGSILPIDLTNGNDGRGGRWFRSSVRRKAVERDLFILGHSRKPFKQKVDIVVTRILGPGQRLWDADSIGRGSAKELIDALVALGWFHDDGPAHIRHCDYRQDATRRDIGPAVKVVVRVAAELPIAAPVSPVAGFEAPETPDHPQGDL